MLMPDILRTNSNIETNSRAGRFKPCKYSEVKLKTNTHNSKLYANAVLKSLSSLSYIAVSFGKIQTLLKNRIALSVTTITFAFQLPAFQDIV